MSRRKKRRFHPLQLRDRTLDLVAVATPMEDSCQTLFTTSLLHMFAYTMNMLLEGESGTNCVFINRGGSLLAQLRQLLVYDAMKLGATHILFIDSDMKFGPDILLKLISHRVDIVGANCLSRRAPYPLTARNADSSMVYTTNESTGIQTVHRVGTGVLLVSMEVFKNLELPWFDTEWLPPGDPAHDEGMQNVCRGEDYYFCDKARKAGYEIHIDHDVSKDVLHIGQFGFSPLLKVPVPLGGEST